MERVTKLAFLGCTTLLVAACGGSETGPSTSTITTGSSYVQLGTTTNQNVSVSALLLDTGTLSTSQSVLLFDGNSDTVISGSDRINLDSTTLSGDYTYVSLLDQIDDTAIVAIQTDINDLPSGSMNYTGEATITVVISDGPNAGTYAGIMTSDISANFVTNAVNVELTDLHSGTVTLVSDPLEANYTATGAETIAFHDLHLSGTGFQDATSSTADIEGFGSSGQVTDTAGSTLSVTGLFAGPNADEVAGVGMISGSDLGLVTFLGD